VAVPALSTYSAATGQPISGGRWPGGVLSGNADLEAAQAAGALGVNASGVSGNVTLADAQAAGTLASDPGNVRIAIWGQSNAVGRADGTDLSASPLSSDAELAQYWSGALTFSRVFIWNGSAYATLTAANNGATSGQFGSEFGLAVRWMRETASGNLYFEKWASSGTSITSNIFTPGVWPYTTGAGYRTSGNSWLASNGITIARDAWVWNQGESDAAMSESTYRGYLDTLMAGLAADNVRPAGNTDILIQIPSGTAGYGSGVVAAKAAKAAADPTRTLTLTAPAYMKADNLHQNGRGQVQLGYDIFEQLFSRSHIAV